MPPTILQSDLTRARRVLRFAPVSDPDPTPLHRALSALLGELIDGPAAEAAWILNPGDPGLLRSLEKLSAASASAVPPNGGSSIAAHVDHLRYGLQVMNRWSRGEDPFADADYAASWRRQAVSDTEWAALLNELRAEARTWCEAATESRTRNDVELTGVLASIAHLAYHLGAIRQIERSTRGPHET
jgi:hypothetical protein